ncbi:cytochrome P450 CYP82D47-like protein, partial [Tanacetum coccineum]
FIDMMMSVVKHDGLAGYDADTIIKSTCMLSLLLNNPGALKKAQEELELHVGDRQVTESDIKDLVYLQAVVKETLRLYPAAFLGGPRVFSEDCTIAGYHVPKGTWLLINMWKLHRDPNIWSDPCEFRPERFLTLDHKDVDVNGTDFQVDFVPKNLKRQVVLGKE